METEARLIRSAEAAGVAVPKVVGILTEDDQLGQGFVTHFIPGEALGGRICRHPSLAAARAVFVEQCATNLALIHSMGLLASTDLAVVTPESEVERLRRAYHQIEQPRAVFAMALGWLQRHMIDPVGKPVLIHGDYRNGNMIVGPEGVRAVLDWEAAHIGDPAEDLSWFCAPSWRFGNLDQPAGGVGSKETFFQVYERESGCMLDQQRLRFWDVFSILRWGLMCASAETAFTSGADPSPQRAIIARRSSEAELDLLQLILPRD